jgi:hypothetical protein
MEQRKNKPSARAPKPKGECIIPPAMPVEALGDFTLNTGGSEADRVRSYVEWQARGETVKHLEKVASESIFGQPMDAWDVRTNTNRWWIITNNTNLYSQKLFPSLDYNRLAGYGENSGLTPRNNRRAKAKSGCILIRRVSQARIRAGH